MTTVQAKQPTCTIRRHHKTSASELKLTCVTPQRRNKSSRQPMESSREADNSSQQLATRHRKLSKMVEYLSDKIRLVKLRQLDGSSKLGFSLRGGKEATGSSVGVFVSHVERLSEAHRKGLKVGDRLIEVNGFSVNEATYDQVISLIKRSPRAQDIVLRVQNLGKIPVQEGAGEPIRWLAVIELLLLDPNAANDFADCHLTEDEASDLNGEPTGQDGQVEAGSGELEKLELELEVGGYEDEGMGSCEESRELARSLSSSEVAGSDGGSSELSLSCVDMPTGAGKRNNEQSTDSAMSSATLGSSSSSSSACSVSVSSVTSSLNSDKQQPLRSGETEQQEGNEQDLSLVQVCVRNDNSSSASFGCGVVKGPDEWPGIFVQNVSAGSLAERVGLEPGDQLVSAQGQQLQELAFDDAIKLIKRLQLHQARLVLQVRKGAALRHLAVHGMSCRPETGVQQLDAGLGLLSGSGAEQTQPSVQPREVHAKQQQQQQQVPHEQQVASVRKLPAQPRRSTTTVGVAKQEVGQEKLGSKRVVAALESQARRQRPNIPPPAAVISPPSHEEPNDGDGDDDDEEVDEAEDEGEEEEGDEDEEEIRIVSQSYKLRHSSALAVPPLAKPLPKPTSVTQQKIPSRCVKYRQAPSTRLRSFDEMRRQMEEQCQPKYQQQQQPLHQASRLQHHQQLSRYVSMDNINNESMRISRLPFRLQVPESCQTVRLLPGPTCCAYSRHRPTDETPTTNQRRTPRPSSALSRQCIGCTWKPVRQLQQHHHQSTSMASMRLVKARSMDKLSLIGAAQPAIYQAPTERMIKLRPANQQQLARRSLLDHQQQASNTCCYLVPACQKAGLRPQLMAAASSHYTSATTSHQRRSSATPSCCTPTLMEPNAGQLHSPPPQTTVIYTSSRRSCYQQTSCCLVGSQCIAAAASVCTAPNQLKKQRSGSTCCCSSACLDRLERLDNNSNNGQQADRTKPTTNKSRDSGIITDHSSGYQSGGGAIITQVINPVTCQLRQRRLARPFKVCAPQPPPPPPPPPPPAQTDVVRREFRHRVSTFFAASTSQPSCMNEPVSGKLADSCSRETEVWQESTKFSKAKAAATNEECIQEYKEAVGLLAAGARKRGPTARPSPPPCPPPPSLSIGGRPGSKQASGLQQVMRPLKEINNINTNTGQPAGSLLPATTNRLKDPLERLCFVDELKMLAERQEKLAASVNTSASSSSDTCPLIKIINASKQQQLAKKAAPKPASTCSCQPSSTCTVQPAACSTLLASDSSSNSTPASNLQATGKAEAKRPHELTTATKKMAAATLSTLAEEDNKRRQHELLMKEFKSVHLRMFKRRINNNNNNSTSNLNLIDDQQHQLAADQNEDDLSKRLYLN